MQSAEGLAASNMCNSSHAHVARCPNAGLCQEGDSGREGAGGEEARAGRTAEGAPPAGQTQQEAAGRAGPQGGAAALSGFARCRMQDACMYRTQGEDISGWLPGQNLHLHTKKQQGQDLKLAAGVGAGGCCTNLHWVPKSGRGSKTARWADGSEVNWDVLSV